MHAIVVNIKCFFTKRFSAQLQICADGNDNPPITFIHDAKVVAECFSVFLPSRENVFQAIL